MVRPELEGITVNNAPVERPISAVPAVLKDPACSVAGQLKVTSALVLVLVMGQFRFTTCVASAGVPPIPATTRAVKLVAASWLVIEIGAYAVAMPIGKVLVAAVAMLFQINPPVELVTT